MPSNDDLLFAEHAVKSGFLSQEDVDETLAVQRRMEEMGVRDTLRNVLVNRGVLREGDAAIVARHAGLQAGREPIPGYTLESRLGAGAMGTVYRAWQRGMQRHVAVKILRRDLTSDPRQVERLRREAALVGKLDHPNIVRGLDSGEHDGLVWFAMEYVEGETLRERIRREGALPPDTAVTLARQVAEALEHAHAQGVVHRDVKPANILLTKEGVPRLSDYGLAKGQTDDALTQVDATLGTPQFVAPEQARNPRDADIRSDVYSLGASLYAMLAGRPPFDGETIAATLTKVLYERPRPLSEAVPGIDPAIVYVVERMMAKDRSHRYPDPSALVADLVALERGRLHVPAGFRGDIGEFVEARRSRRLWFAAAATVVAAVSVAALAYLWDVETDERRRIEAAARELGDVRALPGPEPAWDGATVATMIQRLEQVRSAYPETPAGEQAALDLERWRRQEKALLRAQDLARVADEDETRWPALVAEMEKELGALRADPDAGVARRQVEVQLAGLRDRRERRARRDFGAVEAKVVAGDLGAAAAAYSAFADAAQARWWGLEPSNVVDEARTLARRLREVEQRLDHHFDELDRAAAAPETVETGDFRALEEAIDRASDAARADRELRDLLAALPPDGPWVRGVESRVLSVGDRLDAVAARARAQTETDVTRLRERGDLDGALRLLDAFEARALPEHRLPLAALRADIETERERTAERQRGLVEGAWSEFLDAFGRLDFDRARRAIDRIPAAPPAVGAHRAAAEGAAEFRTAATRLLDATEQLVFERFRTRIAAHAAGGGEITDRRTGIRYRGVTDVRATGWDLRFTYAGDQRWTGTLAVVALDDLLRIADPPLADPGAALAAAALRVSQYEIPQDPQRGLQTLAELAPLLDAARASPAIAPAAERLAEIRDRHVRATRREMDDAEATARDTHARALDALAQHRPGQSGELLRSLLDLPRLRATEYVKRRRDEIREQVERASRALDTEGFASRFPGAAWRESPDGTAELRWDFEDARLDADGARQALGLSDARTRIATRFRPRADRPTIADGAALQLPLDVDHVLEWIGADAAGQPSDAPVQIPCPFQPRRRIEVSFLVRAERPLYLGVVVAGVSAGVLSAPDSPYGGRGVSIWNAVSLDDPDLGFEDRHRSGWLASHPEALRSQGDTRYFHFEPGRVHRVRVVKDEGRTQVFVDGRLRRDEEVRYQPGPLGDRICIVSHGALEIDDLRIVGVPDPAFARRK